MLSFYDFLFFPVPHTLKCLNENAWICNKVKLGQRHQQQKQFDHICWTVELEGWATCCSKVTHSCSVGLEIERALCSFFIFIFFTFIHAGEFQSGYFSVPLGHYCPFSICMYCLYISLVMWLEKALQWTCTPDREKMDLISTFHDHYVFRQSILRSQFNNLITS